MLLKNVLHLYLGCTVSVRKKDRNPEWLTGTMVEISEESNHGDWIKVKFPDVVTVINREWQELQSNFHYYFISEDEIKPHLRHISSMTNEEMHELWANIFGREFNNGRIHKLPAQGSLPARYVLCSGLERLGIEADGSVWYDSDLNPGRFNQHVVTLWLIRKKFDLFNLIGTNQAIKTEA